MYIQARAFTATAILARQTRLVPGTHPNTPRKFVSSHSAIRRASRDSGNPLSHTSSGREISLTMASVARAGEWPSIVTSELVAGKTIRLGAPSLTSTGSIIWLEARPTEQGRQALVSW
jgi:hypothetical protein